MRQPLWDKYETALLIEAYWKIKADANDKNEVVSELSLRLRNRASIDIDEIYRDENGIRMRLAEIDCLFNNGHSGMKNTSELFRKMTKMYAEDRETFEQILMEAKKMEMNENNNQTRFIQWLENNAPKLKPEIACKMLMIGEEFCLKMKVLSCPLFETTDAKTIKRFVKTVSENKVFHMRNKKNHSAIINATNWYAYYVKTELNMNEKEEPEKSSSAIDSAIRLDDVILDYFTEIIDSYPEFEFSNQNAVGELVKRAIYIFPKNQSRRGNVLFEIWQRANEGEFDLYIKRALLTDSEYAESLEGWPKTNDLRGRITRKWREKREIIDYLLPKLDIAKRNLSSSTDVCKIETYVNAPVDEVNRILLESYEGVSKSEICQRLSRYSTYQINIALEKCHGVLVQKKYYSTENISDYQEMAETMLKVITKQFDYYNGYTSAKQLYNEIRPRLDDFFFYNNAFDSRQEVYDLAIHLFNQEKYKGYSFVFANSMHIWEKEPNYPKDYCGLLIKYAREHNNTFSREEAMSYLEWIGSTSPSATFSNLIYTTGSTVFFQYAENQFVLAEALNIGDVFLSNLEAQIENLFGVDGDDYVAMGEIDDFFYSTLPQLPNGVYWTPLLIEDILRTHDMGYITIEAGKDNDKKTYPAAMVRKKSQYRNFGDVVWNEVSKEYSLPKEFTSAEFRDFLLDKGLIRGAEKMWSVHKTVEGDLRFYWTDNNGRVTIN